ncbi:Protein of unknown function [Pyronema omphalodes CBS 100304]|uniref:Uncharacterized protein n=1 Tax=Pyronema omphalodes (strain CBS 100304) TaxID=1076935 RepID=U4LDP3_PYROM|nr:Protein of unknown function [Pyronema omphalodes CBS 100304]
MGLRPIKRHGVFYHQPPPGPDYRQLVRNIMVKRNPTEIPRRSKVSLFESASESRKQNIIEEPEGTQSGYGNMEGYDGTRVNRKAFAVSRPPKHGRKDGEKKVYVKPLILGPRIAKRRLEEDVDEEKSMKEEEKKKVKFSTPHGLQLGCGYPEMIRRQEKARQIQEERKNKEGRLGRETVAQRRERRVHWTPEMRTRVPTPQVTPVVSGAYPQSPPRLAPVPGSPPRSAKRKRGAESDESENAAAVEYEANVRRQKKRRLYTLLDSIQDIVIGGLAGFIDYFAYDWNDEW